MTFEGVDNVVPGHNVPVHVFMAVITIQTSDALRLADKTSTGGAFFAGIIFVYSDDEISERPCLCNGKKERERERERERGGGIMVVSNSWIEALQTIHNKRTSSYHMYEERFKSPM